MRPGKRDADDGDGQENSRDEMAKRQPPSSEHQPYHVPKKAEQSGANILRAGIGGARHRFWPNGNKVYAPILKAALAHGSPTMVIAMMTMAIIHAPPSTSRRRQSMPGSAKTRGQTYAVSEVPRRVSSRPTCRGQVKRLPAPVLVSPLGTVPSILERTHLANQPCRYSHQVLQGPETIVRCGWRHSPQPQRISSSPGTAVCHCLGRRSEPD